MHGENRIKFIILPIVLYVYKTWSLTLREVNKFMVLEYRVLEYRVLEYRVLEYRVLRKSSGLGGKT
jgi:hypothetical protein